MIFISADYESYQESELQDFVKLSFYRNWGGPKGKYLRFIGSIDNFPKDQAIAITKTLTRGNSKVVQLEVIRGDKLNAP